MRRVLIIALAIIVSVFTVGCKGAMSDAWGAKKDDATNSANNTPQTQKAAGVVDGSNNAATTDETGSHNAITEGEDDASKARREKARKSLGMGGG